ncbi:hypothetical protein BDV28DRAFT_12655 [Aspergillus coremiiformis]|uniref:Uncharacterized protein n=1 Tax=Aspergillus coremiiformis TaxID=138285 RepID=A0A5N6Z2F7_9EURO|nr:hypothetical protein BDV28DRAFT_12655 [Aspergillus coremiiformis]
MQTMTITSSAVATITMLPLTTLFTPPPDCSTSWTFVPPQSRTAGTGILLQNALSAVSSCYPPGFKKTGTAAAAQVFSPGYCPIGYTTGDLTVNWPMTTAVCCPSRYSFYKTNLDNQPSQLVGCLSNLPGAVHTHVALAVENTSKDTLVSGPLTMWAQAITVMLRSTDSSLYTTALTASTVTPMPGIVSQSTPTDPPASITLTTLRPYHILTTSATTPSTTSLPATDPPAPITPEPTSLSSGAKAGIGIGVAAIGLAVFVLAILSRIFRRRKSQQRKATADVSLQEREPAKSYKPGFEVKEVRRGPPAELEA